MSLAKQGYISWSLPIIEAIANWEEENGTVAGIMPSEYADFCQMISLACRKGSARGALGYLNGE